MEWFTDAADWFMLDGRGYQFWSGFGGSGLTILTALALFFRHHNCHEPRCCWPAWHTHPEKGHPVCRKHHPDHPRRK